MAFRFNKNKELEICQEYLTTNTNCAALGRKYNATTNTINNLLRRNNIKIRNNQSILQRKFSLNEAYFNKINTEDKAYFLGLLCADGFNNEKQNQVIINLQESDKDILELFRKYIEYEKPLKLIKKHKKNWKNQYKLTINSKKISKYLSSIGIVNNKSLKLKFPKIKIHKSLINHFVRGYIDGDGHFKLYKNRRTNRKQCNFSIVSTIWFCKKIKSLLKKYTGIKSHISITNNKITARLVVGGTNNISTILDWIYLNSNIFLKRKYNYYSEIKKWQNRTKKT